ncbi:DNA-directed RNA polymerase subunit beta [Cryobacterium sp. TMT2-18-3]|uniref:DNA-directed RNA polymerase subunit beta n=1 Tax=unclassified Cryobacterium TaxID=2649013 RepID=UPI00106B543B|nr:MULTISPECIES: DNA-directed RNA polymerase subunit beta [unclassified Cryobacterium]TFC26354.1 DNA-directed RNA polymerase subunit beta [Cryobacterium sp. TMT2-18-2]TFC37666.1 DNA-directed RNA polymerase subunit beta [Cryobacterium sp. TMT2-42-4]TFC60519.1 DNA-directed RNA polymerase subunit beta [Cryobacterium sp. TMT2-15-1]TFC64466.1 DNA-directed RNA polymerase subunit beta [Cryobacterium sp. TMT2-18-3]
MAENFHKPTQFSGSKFESFQGGEDPAMISRVAHETAHALLARVRSDPDPDIVERLVTYTDENGVDAVAELWSRATPRSLPGALWRIYLVRLLIRQDPEGTAFLYQRGTEVTVAIDPVVAGAAVPTGTAEIIVLADQILRGIFTGDFAVALDRAAAFCRVVSVGCTSVADDLETTEPLRSTELTTRALRFSTTAQEFGSCARLWRSDSLD